MTRQRALPDPYLDDEEFQGGFLAGVGELIAAYPSIAGGSAAFAVIFGFVSINALFYQSGRHPAPILPTRGAAVESQQIAVAPDDAAMRQAIEASPEREVSAFKIERAEDNPQTASIPVPSHRPETGLQVTSQPASIAGNRQAAPSMPEPDPVLSAIQKELKRKGFYGGDVDGLMGPMSAAAITNWQRKAGMDIDGKPSALVLESLKIGGRPDSIVKRVEPPVAVPAAAPAPASKPKAERSAQVRPKPAAEIASRSDAGSEPTLRDLINASANRSAAAIPAVTGGDEMVRKIQAGLGNIAYADIAVDGYAGEQTKNAIRAFEKHYRLPVTGEPNDAVLNKLKEIGAL
ncbi:peptidoglycan-binding domain-containing protein [Pseudohoeflea suaedae]|nr:peptidoglycan-binding domain-containing protein [Pseudohoeflea suaedae]